jgi:hypothetical protein
MELEKKNSRFALLLIAMLWAVGAQAVVITTPINYTTNYLVGTADVRFSANPATVVIWANYILGMGAGETDNVIYNAMTPQEYDVDYRTHDSMDYNAVLTALDSNRVEDESTDVGAGWDYAFAKYNGQNAGYVLYFLNGEATDLPQYSNDIWTNGQQDKGYALSNYTTFGSRDCCETKLAEPGTLGLMMIGMIGVGASRIRRRRSVK